MGERRNMERRTVEEKKMMIQMKRLCLPLSPLTSLNESSQEDPLEQVATYIKNQEERVQLLRQKRAFEKSVYEITRDTETGIGIQQKQLPFVKMRHKGRELEIVMLSEITRKLRFYEVIGLLEREGIEITNGTHSVVGDTIIYAIRAEASPEIDYHALLMDKLKALVQ